MTRVAIELTTDPLVPILERARELVARGECRGQHACDEHGETVASLDIRAVRWCPTGAIRRAAIEIGAPGNGSEQAAQHAIASVIGTMRPLSVLYDGGAYSLAEWDRFFERAIERARDER